MQLYCGIDPHAKNSYLAIIDERRQRIFKRNVANDRQLILSLLAACKAEWAGVVVESTFNWMPLTHRPTDIRHIRCVTLLSK